MPNSTEAEVDLRLYKNSENETKILREKKLAAGYSYFSI